MATAKARLVPQHEILWEKVGRLYGDPSTESARRCIRLCRRILKMVRRLTHPRAWARATLVLEEKMLFLPRAKQPSGQEERLRLLTSLLSHRFIRKQSAMRVRWHLGSLYSDRFRGDRSRNLEQAIQYLTAASRMASRKKDPKRWAAIRMELSDAYRDRVQAPHDRNFRRARFHLQQAEGVFNRRRYPEMWAAVQSSYGQLVCQYPWLSEERRRLLAIGHEKRALEVWTRSSSPLGWTDLQNNLARDYEALYNVRHRPEDLKTAYRHMRNAVRVWRQLGIGDPKIRRDGEACLARLVKFMNSSSLRRLK